MKKIDIKDLNENFIQTIGKEWMLVTAGNSTKYNTMTASWGGIGFIWNKPVVFVFIRPQRYTFEFTERESDFTLSFFEEQYHEALQLCGSKSGRDIDKAAATGLVPEITENGNVTFQQARLVLECKKLYADMISPELFIDKSLIDKWFAAGDFHKMYVAEIVQAYSK